MRLGLILHDRRFKHKTLDEQNIIREQTKRLKNYRVLFPADETLGTVREKMLQYIRQMDGDLLDNDSHLYLTVEMNFQEDK